MIQKIDYDTLKEYSREIGYTYDVLAELKETLAEMKQQWHMKYDPTSYFWMQMDKMDLIAPFINIMNDDSINIYHKVDKLIVIHSSRINKLDDKINRIILNN